MFSFTSPGGIVDKEINKGHGPYVFRMHGQNYHHIGTLLPEEGSKPRWAQLYIYDTENEVQNRISATRCGDGKTPLDPSIVSGLQSMGLPGADEVAALVIKDPTDETQGRDIIIEYKDVGPKRISEIHPKLMAMQYPLLFPYGEDGFTLEIPYQQKDGVAYKRNHVSMLEYNAYYLHHRPNQSMSLLMSGHLSLQFWVDVYTCIKQQQITT